MFLYICLFLPPPWQGDSQQSCRQVAFQIREVSFDFSSFLFCVGDGANDVSMIQVADTGVGISGQEGMQVVYAKTAAMTSDSILNRFRVYPGGPVAP